MTDSTEVWQKNLPAATGNFNTMHTFDGDGNPDRAFEINFSGGYISKSHVKAYMMPYGTAEYEYLDITFVNESTVRLSAPVPVGWVVTIYRDTPKDVPLASFTDGALITAGSLDRNAEQAIFGVAEMVDRYSATQSNSDLALDVANEAMDVSNQAATTANAAKAAADAALRVPPGDVIQALPSAEGRANKMIAFNDAGQPITVVPTDGTASSVMIEYAKPTGAALVGTPTGTVQSDLDATRGDITTLSNQVSGIDKTLRADLGASGSSVLVSNTRASRIAENANKTKYAEAPDVYDLFITYGQSNSLGEAGLSGDTSGFPAPLERSLKYDFADGTIKPINQSMVSSTGEASTGHAWGEFTNEWYRQSGRGSVVVQCGRGARNITDLSKGGGATYTALVTAVASAKQAMISAGLTMGKVYVLFHQGEADMSEGTTFNQYRDRLITLISDLKADVQMDLFCNFTVGCPGNRSETSWAGIQNAQQWVCSVTPNAVTVFNGCPSFLYGKNTVNVNTDGGVHYTQSAYNTMGREGARGLWSIVQGGASNLTTAELELYKNEAAQWARTKYAAGSIRHDGSSWVLDTRGSARTEGWRVANLHRPVINGKNLQIEVADVATAWFSVDATVSRSYAGRSVRAVAEPQKIGNAYTLQVSLFCDLDFLVNTTTGEVRYGRPPATGDMPNWMASGISISVVNAGEVEITHAAALGMPQATPYLIPGTTAAASNAGVIATSTTTTRVYSTTGANTTPWVAVHIPNVYLDFSKLVGSDIVINVKGVYAPI